MNQEYEIVLSLPPRGDIENIYEGITQFSNEDDADNWEIGLYESLHSLKFTPNHQECERETRITGLAIRRILYRQKGVKREYHVYYTIEPSPVGTAGVAVPFLGRVVILFLLHASQKPLSKKALLSRIQAVRTDVAEVDAIRAEFEQDTS
jgi:hypothetical protein